MQPSARAGKEGQEQGCEVCALGKRARSKKKMTEGVSRGRRAILCSWMLGLALMPLILVVMHDVRPSLRYADAAFWHRYPGLVVVGTEFQKSALLLVQALPLRLLFVRPPAMVDMLGNPGPVASQLRIADLQTAVEHKLFMEKRWEARLQKQHN